MFISHYYYTIDALKQSIKIIKNTSFFNMWSKEAIENFSYSSKVNKIDGYLDASIIHTSSRCIISRDKEISENNRKRKRSQGGNILRLLRKST